LASGLTVTDLLLFKSLLFKLKKTQLHLLTGLNRVHAATEQFQTAIVTPCHSPMARRPQHAGRGALAWPVRL
jgi:hypothetical protein